MVSNKATSEEASIKRTNVPNRKARAKKVRVKRPKTASPEIVIDREAGLVFKSEKQLFEYFAPQVTSLEEELAEKQAAYPPEKIEIPNLEAELEMTLDEPAEIWYDSKTFKEFPIFHFIRPLEEPEAFHVSCTYVSSDDEPTFIFLHFVTRNLDLISQYRRGDLVYDRAFEEVEFGMLDGDALSEGDPLAMGLFLAMLKLRSTTDLKYEKFREIGTALREETIESADEIWRSNDMKGNVLVTFIKEYPDHELGELDYIAITQEDIATQTHSLLFSFPTTDETLVDRYRHGENLQAEDVSQESSH